MVVTERPEKPGERVSQDRETLAPQPRTTAKIREPIHPMTGKQTTKNGYPSTEANNIGDIENATAALENKR